MKKIVVLNIIVLLIITTTTLTYAGDITDPGSLNANKTEVAGSLQNIGNIIIGIFQVIRSGNSRNFTYNISNKIYASSTWRKSRY